MPKKIMLLDANSLINRAFFAIPALTDGEGRPTNAVYGFMSIFIKLYNEEAPDAVMAAFDLPAPTFRHGIYAEYKATRKPMPDDLRPQIPMLKNLLRLMNVSVCEKEGLEADDILGTLAKRAEASGFDVTLVSGDRDLLQIASDKTMIRIPKTKAGKTEVEDYHAADLLASHGVTPSEFIEVKALMGDASDNIPGVPGIGEKTAYKIITEYKTIENALENADKITPKKAAENLVNNAELAFLSRKLAAIDTNADMDFSPAFLSKSGVFNPSAFEEIRRLNFRSLYSLFEKEEATTSEKDFSFIGDMKGLESLAKKLEQSDMAAFCSISDEGGFLGLSFCWGADAAVFAGISPELDENDIIVVLKPFFENRKIKKLCPDLKKELLYLEKRGIILENAVFDMGLAAYVLDVSEGYAYEDLARKYLSETFPSREEVFGKGKNKTEYTALNSSDEKLVRYACANAYTAFNAPSAMLSELEANSQSSLYYDIELPLVYVLKDMELYGIRVDRASLSGYGEKLDGMIDSLTKQIHLLAGEEFNIASPKQLGEILFEKLGLKAGKKTKTGYSTAADVLNELRGKHEIVDMTLEYRTYAKLKSTYVDGLLDLLEADGRVYSTFNQLVTSTGRISSSEPNLQNIPIRYALGRELRKVFIPDEGYLLMDADYSQIELRILAHLSGDETLIAAFREGDDIHTLTASQVFGVLPEFVTPEQRGNAKAVNFGIVYGISAYSLSVDLGISVKEAGRYIDGYFSRYPRVKTYLGEIVDSAKTKGYAETMFARKRRIPELKSSNFASRSFGERAAMNMPIQGSAADIIKIAMVRVHKRLKDQGLKSRLILQVHDELLLEVYKPETETVAEILKHEMENACFLASGLEAEVKCGGNWFEAH